MEVNRGAFVGAIVLVVAVNIAVIALVLGSLNGPGQLPAAPVAGARPAPAPASVGLVLTPLPPGAAPLAPTAIAPPPSVSELRAPTAPAAALPPAARSAAPVAPPAVGSAAPPSAGAPA